MKSLDKLEVAGIKFAVRITPIKKRQLPIKGMDAGARHFNCTVTRQDGWQGAAFTLEYSQGSGVKLDPNADDILQCAVGDALVGFYTFEEFCDELDANPDSRSDYATWEACKATCDAFARMGIEEDELYQINEALEYVAA